MTIIIIILICLLLFLLFKREPKQQTINFFSGGLGSGKTFMITRLAHRAWFKSKIVNILTFGKVKVRDVYSNYPIRLSKHKWSKRLTKGHLLGYFRLPERCIVVLYEASSIFPNLARKSEEITTYSFRWFRHFTNGTIYMADQSIGDIDIAIRRRVNKVYNLSSFRKFFIFYKVDIEELSYMEDVTSYVQTRDINDNFKKFFGLFPFKRRYNSRYARKWYTVNVENTCSFVDFYLEKS